MWKTLPMCLSILALVFTLPACGGSSNPPELGALGDDCSDGDDCTSGFCNADICSECEGDEDCGADETCVDDTDGEGYFVCQGDDLGALGDACTDGAECQSGFCAGDVCSECEADGDCSGAQTCVDDTAGAGYFVCQGGLGELGDACADGAECASGFCNGDVCSECEVDGDCEGAETCIDATGTLGYFVCQEVDLGALGDACADGAECDSGFCNGDVCSECVADGDCAGAQTCVDDIAGVGYFVCQGGAGALGDACADGTECASGLCNGGVCSECETDGDCGADETCEDDMAGAGYFVCEEVVLGALGDVCAEGADCASGFCNTGICSECEADGDCGADESCVDDLNGVGWFICQEDVQGALGDACAEGADCNSGFCFDPPGPPESVCSECEVNGDCDVQQDCIWDPGMDYAQCLGTGDLGDACDTGDQCISGFCADGVCSECQEDLDCAGGGTCFDDTDGVGWWVCDGGLGDDCVDSGDCASGFCNNDICSECEANGDCDVQQECDWDGDLDYYTCQGTGDLGDPCDTGVQCVSGSCAGGVCSECESDGDCDGASTCVDDTDGVGWWVCLAGLGDMCMEGGDCASGFCHNPPGPGARYCSECAEDGDCGDQQICLMDDDLGWATCVGDGDLGDPCSDGSECTSGICQGDVCSECAADGDCADSGACVDGTQDVGYFYCAGALGESCQSGAECASGYCWESMWQIDYCSECEQDGDCGDQQVCDFDMGDGYASCVGTGDLGDACNSGDECQSLICNTGVCSECETEADCGEGGGCIDDTGGIGYFVCEGGLGDACQSGAECVSGFCYDMPGPLEPVCSECEDNGDCGNNESCQVDWMSFYAVCQ